MTGSTERAVFAGGCFWGMQDLLRRYPGVLSTRVGYTGGDVRNATYRNHGTHAEAIEIVFDPQTISYRNLLEFFFQIHDPTTLNRQGNDVGTQYRSAIFHHSELQRAVAAQVLREAQVLFEDDIVTQLEPVERYARAETHHQEYFRNNPTQGYCMFVIGPKLEKFRRTFARKRRAGVS